MNCPMCKHSYTTQTYLPIIDETGNTQCLQCSLKINSSFQNIQTSKLPINKELIKVMGKCPQHKETTLTLFNLKTKKRQCPKCVIFSKDKKKYQDCTFVQIDEQNNKIDNVLQAKLQHLQTNLDKIQNDTLVKSNNLKRKILHSVLAKLEQCYNQMIQNLKIAYQNQKIKIVNYLDKNYQMQCFESFTQFNNIKKECVKVLQHSKNVKFSQKYDKIADSVRLFEELNKIKQTLFKKSQNFSQNVKQFEQKYECGFTIDIKNKQKVEKLQEKQEEILIDIKENNQDFIEQVSYIDFSSEKFELKSMQSMPSTQRTNLTISTERIMMQPLKNTFIATQISDLNKIQTQVKQIQAKNLNITNTDAKKILTSVSKSFVKILDLSQNKITSGFLKDLNKSNIGKYLRTIKLCGNDISIKDGSATKKIQQLKTQGVNVLL